MIPGLPYIQSPPLYTAATSVYPYASDLEAKFKFEDAFGEPVNMSQKEGNMLLVPRNCAPIGLKDYRVKHDRFAINCNFTPNSQEQGDVCEKSIQLLLSGHNHIFDAPTGFGKTVCGSYIACKIGQPTIIVVTKDDLVDQWKDALVKVLGVPPALVGHVQQDTCNWQGKKFVIAMVHSLIIPDRYPPEMYRYFGMAIFDEVHLMAADSFSRACTMFPAFYRLGFSATEKRRDGKSKILYSHIGPVLVKGTQVPMKPRILVEKTGWRIPTRTTVENGQRVEKKITHAPGRMAFVTKAMAKSPQRNAILTNFVGQAYKAGRITLVLSDLIEDHLQPLFHLLAKSGVPGNDIGFYVGGMKKTELEATKTRRVVLGTYQMVSTGTNVPHWDTLVLATPRSNVKQSIGRIMRYLDGKRQPLVFDPVDYDSIFNNFFLARLKQYHEVNADIVKG